MIVGRRDYKKILKVLRNKNLGNEYNFIYDNINKIDDSMIDRSNLKDAHKKLLKLYKKDIKDYDNSPSISIAELEDSVKGKISYGSLPDRVGDIYVSNSDDTFCSNILIKYGSKLFYSFGKWYFKHIEIKTTPKYLSLYKKDSDYNHYKDIVNGEIDTSNSTIINVGKQPTTIQQYGVKFY